MCVRRYGKKALALRAPSGRGLRSSYTLVRSVIGSRFESGFRKKLFLIEVVLGLTWQS